MRHPITPQVRLQRVISTLCLLSVFNIVSLRPSMFLLLEPPALPLLSLLPSVKTIVGNLKRKHLWQGTGRDLVQAGPNKTAKQTQSPYGEERKPKTQIPEHRQTSAKLPHEKQRYNMCSRKTFSVLLKWLVITCRFVVLFYHSWICVGCWKLRILEPNSLQAMNSNTLQPLNMSISRPRPSLQGTGSQSLPWQWKQEKEQATQHTSSSYTAGSSVKYWSSQPLNWLVGPAARRNLRWRRHGRMLSHSEQL